jgi:serine protease AprX
MSTVRRSCLTTLGLALGVVAVVSSAASAQQGRATNRPEQPNAFARAYRLDPVVAGRAAARPQDRSSLVVRLAPGADLPSEFQRYSRGGKLALLNGVVLDGLPNGLVAQLAASPSVASVHDNRPLLLHNYRTAVTVGARVVQDTLGLTGRGVTIAVIDTGITTYHDDLTRGPNSPAWYPYGDQRVLKFVDFVGNGQLPYDDNGHGSHVAGTIAGNGYDSGGQKAGIAPDASIVSLKVLDANGRGTIGNIIGALDWVAKNAATYNIRIVSLSVGAAVRESFWTDPLTLAVRALTDRGIIVVAAAGNLGSNANGQPQYGGITAPGNAPWTLTVGASSTEGTLTRRDDVVAPYSSRGPTFIDWVAKPDLVAPGTGTVSLAVPGSTFYASKPEYLVKGSFPTGSMPYLTLTGTSMSAPVVAGTVALMLQANPRLTPNLVKAILQYTAQLYPGYNPLTEGAGFLNTLGAVRLAQFYANARPGMRVPIQRIWSRQILWGSHRITGGIMVPSANAWGTTVVWGSAKTAATAENDGQNIVWGLNLDNNIVWGLNDRNNIVWGLNDANNIVWGLSTKDNIVWGLDADGNIVWGLNDSNNIVWGLNDSNNIVWGLNGPDSALWRVSGTSDNIVWGLSQVDNIVWGLDCGGADCDQVVWGAVDRDNIVWGLTDGQNIVWGLDTDGNIVWGLNDMNNIVWGLSNIENIVWGLAADDGTWGVSRKDAAVFRGDDDAKDIEPNVQDEFGESGGR